MQLRNRLCPALLACMVLVCVAAPAWSQTGLIVMPSPLHFQQIGSTVPPAQQVSLSIQGGGAFAFTAQPMTTSGGSWLSVSPAAGAGPGMITVSVVGTSSLVPAVYHGSIAIVAAAITGGSVVLSVDLEVVGATTGSLVVRPDELEFHAKVGGPAPPARQIVIANPATASFAWTAVASTSSGGTWLKVNPASGTGMLVLDVSVDPTALAAGEYKGKIVFTSGSTMATENVDLTVSPPEPAHLALEPRSIHFNYEQGDVPRSRNLEVELEGGTTASWTAKATVTSPSGGTWLSISPTSGGTGSNKITVEFNPNGLTPGTYNGVVHVTAGSLTADTNVFLTITGPDKPRVFVRPKAMRFLFHLNGGFASPGSRTIEITGKTSLPFTATATSQGGNWLTINPASGMVPGSITVSINGGVAGTLAPGWYTGNVEVKTPGAIKETHNVHVGLRVLAASEPARLDIDPGALAFHATAGLASPASQKITVRASGAASIAWTAAVSTAVGGSWLSATPLTVTTAAGTATDVQVSVNTTGIAPGIYAGAIVFTPAASSGATIVSVLVKLVVSAPGAAADSDTVQVEAASQPMVAVTTDPPNGFVSQAGVPVNVTVKLLDSRGSATTGARVTVTSSGPEPELELEDQGDGTFWGAFRPVSSGSRTLFVNVNGQVDSQAAVTGTVESADRADVIFQGGVVNAGSFTASPAPVAAGSLVAAFGLSMSDRSGIATLIPLPANISGTTVTIGGFSAPLFSVTTGTTDQINMQVPFELAGTSEAEVVIRNNGRVSAAETIALAASPALFTVAGNGSGPGAFLHADFSAITASRPARAGEVIVLYATGLGTVTPAVATGSAASAAVITRVNGNVTVTIGGRAAQVLFAGLAPSFVGLYQINVIVPAGNFAGDNVVKVTTNGITSSGNATVSVQ